MKTEKFTIDDIHRIRYENYEETKNMSADELIERTKKAAAPGWERLAALRKSNENN
jgi:hypothetical protein